MSSRLSRRRFLHASAVGAAAGFFSGAARADREPGPSEKLGVAVIGVAGQGDYNLRNVAAANTNIVALCDVDENRAAKARADFPRAVFDPDYHKVLDTKGLDAVV